MQFKDYFNAYDTVGNLHNGFLQAMDFSAFTDVTMLNELTMALMDAHLQNELSGSLVLKQWAKYMHFSKENDRLEVWAQFYTDFKNALYAKLLKSEKWYQITKTDFTSLSATDIKTIEHGSKVTDFDYAQAQKTKQYGQDQTTTQYGQTLDTSVYGAAVKQLEYGAQTEQSQYAQRQDTDVYGAGVLQKEYGATETTHQHDAVVNQKDYDRVVVEVSHDGNDSHVIGAGGGTTTHKIYPLGASEFVNDSQDVTSTNAQTNTDTWADVTTDTGSRTDVDTTAARSDTDSSILHTDVETTAEKTDTHTAGAHTDVVTDAAHTDVVTDASRTDTVTGSQHTDTATRSQRTDTETDAAKKDTQTIKAYTDTERHTKHIVLSPDKYFEIEKEMVELGVYDLMTQAVRDTMLLNVWEEGACEWN